MVVLRPHILNPAAARTEVVDRFAAIARLRPEPTENLAARGTKGKSKANKRKEIVKKRAGFEGTAKPLN